MRRNKFTKFVKNVSFGIQATVVVIGGLVVAPFYLTYIGIVDAYLKCPNCGKRSTLKEIAVTDGVHIAYPDGHAEAVPPESDEGTDLRNGRVNYRRSIHTICKCSSCGEICTKQVGAQAESVTAEYIKSLEKVHSLGGGCGHSHGMT